MSILQIVLPIFIIIGIGYTMRKVDLVKDEWVHVLNKFVYYVSLPALIVISFWEVNWLDKHLVYLVFMNLVFLLLFSALLLFALSSFKISNKLKASIFLSAIVGNTVYMGFPLIGAALGKESFSDMIAVATSHLVMAMVFSVLAVEFLVVKSRQAKTYLADFIKNPLVISLLVGIIFSLVKLPSAPAYFIQKPLAMLGTTASPVALFALGGFLHGKFYKSHFKAAFAASFLKLLVLPVFVLIASAVLKMNYASSRVSFLVAAMPTAVTAFVISEKYKLDESFVANVILLSAMLSVICLSGFLAFFVL